MTKLTTLIVTINSYLFLYHMMLFSQVSSVELIPFAMAGRIAKKKITIPKKLKLNIVRLFSHKNLLWFCYLCSTQLLNAAAAGGGPAAQRAASALNGIFSKPSFDRRKVVRHSTTLHQFLISKLRNYFAYLAFCCFGISVNFIRTKGETMSD